MNREVCTRLKVGTADYNSGDLDEYWKSRYELQKSQYRMSVESYCHGPNTGLRTITDYKRTVCSNEEVSESLPGQPNTFMHTC